MAENKDDADKRMIIIMGIMGDLEDKFDKVPDYDKFNIFNPTFYNENNADRLKERFALGISAFKDEMIRINKLLKVGMFDEPVQKDLKPFINKLEELLKARLKELEQTKKERDVASPKTEKDTNAQAGHYKSRDGQENQGQYPKSDPGPSTETGRPKKKL